MEAVDQRRKESKSEQNQGRKWLDEGSPKLRAKKTIHTKEPLLDPLPRLYKEENATHMRYTI